MPRAMLAAALLLAACSTVEGSLRKNVGADVSEAIVANGAPTQTADLPDGGKAYTWVQRQGASECWITLTADHQGVVRRYSYRGCPNAGPSSGMGP